jgi:hypothetical protein
VVVLEFFAEGRHLVVDAVVTTVYRNTIGTNASTIRGYDAKQDEDRKFLADRASSQPIAEIHGGPHVLVTLLCLEQSDQNPTPTEKPRKVLDVIADIAPMGHAP